jgi:hypothetical protein
MAQRPPIYLPSVDAGQSPPARTQPRKPGWDRDPMHWVEWLLWLGGWFALNVLPVASAWYVLLDIIAWLSGYPSPAWLRHEALALVVGIAPSVAQYNIEREPERATGSVTSLAAHVTLFFVDWGGGAVGLYFFLLPLEAGIESNPAIWLIAGIGSFVGGVLCQHQAHAQFCMLRGQPRPKGLFGVLGAMRGQGQGAR